MLKITEISSLKDKEKNKIVIHYDSDRTRKKPLKLLRFLYAHVTNKCMFGKDSVFQWHRWKVWTTLGNTFRG